VVRSDLGETVFGRAGEYGKPPRLRQLVVGRSDRAVQQLLDQMSRNRLIQEAAD
jgi:hypothetical protein